VAADVQAIHALRAQFQSAENTADIEALAATLAEDVIILAPNRPAIEGAAATVEHFRGQFSQVVLELQYASLESVASGDWGFDRGTYTATVTPKAGGEPATSRGKYLWISRRGADGQWHLARITWNGNGGS
jgi:ketosteroid isomerase-like protein